MLPDIELVKGGDQTRDYFVLVQILSGYAMAVSYNFYI